VPGNDVIVDGGTMRVRLTGYNSPIFGIRRVDEYGDTCSFWNVDVSQRGLVVTLGDIDRDPCTRPHRPGSPGSL
jgi:hypothetical protein